MKTNKVLIVLLALVVSGCSLTFDDIRNEYIHEKLLSEYKDTPIYYGDFSTIHHAWQIPYWVRTRVEYRATASKLSPEEILKLGYCDCDGYALIYMNIMYVQFGLKYSICFLDTDARKIIDGGEVDHAIVRAPTGELLQAQTGQPYYGSIGYEYTFDEVFIKE